MKYYGKQISSLLLGACVLGALLLATTSAQAVKFRLPLAVNTSTHYYYDHAGAGALDDWKCGNETYDGHRGTDFSGGPRGTAIYAAAVGTLSYKIDGFGDGYRGSPDGGGFGNYVRLAHADGFMTYYGHMTIGSVTTKAVGSGIACGEKVGGVGTSGSSTGLHLHFEPRINGTADDPYSGTCGGPLSYWVNQNGGNPVTTCEGATSTKTARNVDNPSGVATGTWATGTGSTDKLGTDYRYKSTAPISEPFTWSTSLNTSATWNVRAWWPQGSNRSTTAPYIVSHSAGTTTVNKNQQINGGSWQLLGSWSMSGTQTVKLSCWTTTGFIVVADGVRWD
jgi:murein DD-endopeptidase MepM/ murein hydrolase activator NlpD